VRLTVLFGCLIGLAGCTAGTPASSAVGSDIVLTPDTTTVRGEIPRNTTLDTMLRAEGLAADAAQQLIAAVRTVFDPRQLKAAQPYVIEKTLEGALRLFEYEIDFDRLLRIAPAAIGAIELRAEVLPIPKRLEHAQVSGTIGGDTPSLYQAMDAAGENPELTIAMAEILSGEIDFNNDPQDGDRFAASFDKYIREDRPVTTYGAITAVEFQNAGRVIRAIRFTLPDGKAGYFDEQGRSLRRFFLKSPLKFDPRITSRFATRRMHPILRTARAHNGVDYAAPSGAPIVAVASGTVIGATFDNANGRMVRLRHTNGYVTYYLHMSRFAAGMRAGARINQGETIGYVGSTGLATGPHLHYGLQRNGRWVDPVREHRNMPPGDPVPASVLDAFNAARDVALDELASALDTPRNPAVVTTSQ
jgi:murein DD-endopeptidase MepM/ murein hydrolase activator NlpD